MYKLTVFACLVWGWLFIGAVQVVAQTGEASDAPVDNLGVIKHESGFYYTIRKGDTLWDLSQRFSDSPWIWPDLWQQNQHIANPHWIYPGQKIRLYLREGHHTIPAPVPAPPVPAPVEVPLPVPFYYYAGIDSVGFISREPLEASGTIFHVKDNKTDISEGDLVYIRPGQDSNLSPGENFSIFRRFPATKDPETNTHVGYQHLFVGIAQVARQEPKFVLATILRSYRSIKEGDMLTPYRQRSPEISLVAPEPSLNAEIILGEERQTLIGDHEIAFINKGEQDGILIGQQYHVYYQEKAVMDAKSGEEVMLPPIVFGSLLVLHTEPTTATVVITQADRSLKAGSKIGLP